MAIQAARDERVVLVETPLGRIEFCNNELTVLSTVDDPPKVRMAAPAGTATGCVSGNVLRADGVGQDEKVLLILKEQDGYDVFQQRPGTSDDAGMTRLLTLSLAGVDAKIPLPSGPTPRMVSPNGRFILNVQNDGNLVMYDTHGNADETTWTPVWWTGPHA